MQAGFWSQKSVVVIQMSPVFLQSASAFLDQHCEEPSVYLWCPGVGPRGRRAVCHCPDLHGLLHHRWAQAGTGEAFSTVIVETEQRAFSGAWKGQKVKAVNYVSVAGTAGHHLYSNHKWSWQSDMSWSSLRSLLLSLVLIPAFLFWAGLSHQQAAVCQRHPPLQADGRKVGSHLELILKHLLEHCDY